MNDDCNKNSDGSRNFSFNLGCDDINGGFQQIYPEVFIVIAEILGDVMAGKLPFNVQNAVGNWFELVGQVILTYNAQQQYFQGGPGRYFNPAYYNVSNPFCDSGITTEGNSSSGTYMDQGESEDFFNRSNNNTQINELKEQIENLKKELENIKNSIGIK